MDFLVNKVNVVNLFRIAYRMKMDSFVSDINSSSLTASLSVKSTLTLPSRVVVTTFRNSGYFVASALKSGRVRYGFLGCRNAFRDMFFTRNVHCTNFLRGKLLCLHFCREQISRLSKKIVNFEDQANLDYLKKTRKICNSAIELYDAGQYYC